MMLIEHAQQLRWSVDASAGHDLEDEHYRLWLSDPLALYGIENAKFEPRFFQPEWKG